jgi:hypothetical protein
MVLLRVASNSRDNIPILLYFFGSPVKEPQIPQNFAQKGGFPARFGLGLGATARFLKIAVKSKFGGKTVF